MKYEDVLKEEDAPEEKRKYGVYPSKYPRSITGRREIIEPTTEMTFSVVEEDVVGSVVADKESCAAARALCRMPDVEHAWVFRSVTLVKLTSGEYQRYKNPRNLQKLVERFDDSAGLFPAGDYVLRPLPESHRRAYKKKWNDAHKDRSGGKRPYERVVTSPKPLRNK